MPDTRGGISETAQQSQTDSGGTWMGESLVSGSCGAAILGASCDQVTSDLRSHPPSEKRTPYVNRQATNSSDERGAEHRVGMGGWWMVQRDGCYWSRS